MRRAWWKKTDWILWVALLVSAVAVIWSVIGGTSEVISARATLSQAILALSVLIATLRSESRSRAQLEAAQEEAERSRQPSIVVSARNILISDTEYIVLDVVNLSFLPIFLESVRLETLTAYPEQHEIPVNRRTLASTEHTEIKLDGADPSELDQKYNDTQVEDDENDEDYVLNYMYFPYTELLIVARYGGNPTKKFIFNYRVKLHWGPGGRPAQRKWFIEIIPDESMGYDLDALS